MSRKKSIAQKIIAETNADLAAITDSMRKEHDGEIAAIESHLRNNSLSGKRQGDRVWYVDYASRKTQPAWLFEERFISFEEEKGNVLTLRGERVFIHREEDVFGDPAKAAHEMERFCLLDDTLSESLRMDRRNRRNHIDS